MQEKPFTLKESGDDTSNGFVKFTDWANEPTLNEMKTDLQNAKPAHDAQMLKVRKWNNLRDVKGEAKPEKVKGRSSVQPKLIRRQAEWRYSALSEPFLSSDKPFKVSPVSFEDGNGARQNEKVLNYQFRTKINRVKFVDEYVRVSVDEGTSIVQVGWIRHSVDIEQEVPVYSFYPIESEEQLNALKQALEIKVENPRGFTQLAPEMQEAVRYFEETQTPTYAQQTGTTKQKVPKLLQNQPTAKVLNPNNVVIDPSCEGDIDNAKFVIVSFETCKADLMREGKRYRNLDSVNWENATPLTDPDHKSGTPDTFNMKGVRKKVVAYEYWGFYDIDGTDELKPFVATWIGNTLIRMELNPFPDQKLPFVLVSYNPVKRDVYGEPDAEMLEDNQAILGAIMRGMIDLLGRSANGQQGFAKGMLDPLNRRRFENGQDYEFNPNMPPQQGHITHQYPEIPNSALTMVQLQNQDAEAISGVKSFAGGLSGESYGDVAAGIKGAMDAAAKREMAILRRLAKGMADIGAKFASMNQAFLSEQETVRITNDEFEVINRDELGGNFDFAVDISTAEIDNAKSQDLAFMLQTMGPNMDLGITLMILAEIAELKRMPELAKKIRSFKPEPDPVAEEMKQLELEKLKLEIQELRSKAMLNEAKAKRELAETDKSNLDFVEQETGTKHARDMEKISAQAESNQDLQVTKALTTVRKDGEKDPDIEAAIGWNAVSKQPTPVAVRPQTPVDFGLSSLDSVPQEGQGGDFLVPSEASSTGLPYNPDQMM